jgi:hypothetical protein
MCLRTCPRWLSDALKLAIIRPGNRVHDEELITAIRERDPAARYLSGPGRTGVPRLNGLKRRRLWPRCQYRAVVDTADETAKLAGKCAIIRRAVALARWVGPEGKALTRVGVLRKPAVPGACAAIGIRLPERFRSAADIPGVIWDLSGVV